MTICVKSHSILIYVICPEILTQSEAVSMFGVIILERISITLLCKYPG